MFYEYSRSLFRDRKQSIKTFLPEHTLILPGQKRTQDLIRSGRCFADEHTNNLVR